MTLSKGHSWPTLNMWHKEKTNTSCFMPLRFSGCLFLRHSVTDLMLRCRADDNKAGRMIRFLLKCPCGKFPITPWSGSFQFTEIRRIVLWRRLLLLLSILVLLMVQIEKKNIKPIRHCLVIFSSHFLFSSLQVSLYWWPPGIGTLLFCLLAC